MTYIVPNGMTVEGVFELLNQNVITLSHAIDEMVKRGMTAVEAREYISDNFDGDLSQFEEG